MLAHVLTTDLHEGRIPTPLTHTNSGLTQFLMVQHSHTLALPSPHKYSPAVATFGDIFKRTPIVVEDRPPSPSDNLTAATADLGGVEPELSHDVFGDGREKVTRMQMGTAYGAEVQRNEEFGKGLDVIGNDNMVPTPTPTPAPALGPVSAPVFPRPPGLPLHWLTCRSYKARMPYRARQPKGSMGDVVAGKA
jgi:hypothetical protein